MTDHFGDRLIAAVREKRVPACVGLDPLVDRLPKSVLRDAGIDPNNCGLASTTQCAAALLDYGRGVIRTIAPYVPAIKINIAFFEVFQSDGVSAYLELVHSAQQAGLIVIGDIKRADIGHSTERYAQAHLASASASGDVKRGTADAVTVNPYFGIDGILPFVDIAHEQGRGLFVLVQTSNKSAVEIQGLSLSDGSTVCQHVAGLVEGWASQDRLIGDEGYSCIGAVVSPRDLESTVRIRTLMPHCIFLVPGFGAQGRTTAEVATCFKADGTGALVTASRSVIYAYEQPEHKGVSGDDWCGCVDRACVDLVKSVRSVLPAFSESA